MGHLINVLYKQDMNCMAFSENVWECLRMNVLSFKAYFLHKMVRRQLYPFFPSLILQTIINFWMKLSKILWFVSVVGRSIDLREQLKCESEVLYQLLLPFLNLLYQKKYVCTMYVSPEYLVLILVPTWGWMVKLFNFNPLKTIIGNFSEELLSLYYILEVITTDFLKIVLLYSLHSVSSGWNFELTSFVSFHSALPRKTVTQHKNFAPFLTNLHLSLDICHADLCTSRVLWPYLGSVPTCWIINHDILQFKWVQ